MLLLCQTNNEYFKDSPFNTDCINFVNKTPDISSDQGIEISFIGDFFGFATT